MAGRSCLLDTNIVIAILNQEEALKDHLTGTTVYLATVVLGELYFGAYRSARKADNLKRLETLVERYEILTCDKTTAMHYGQIKTQLSLKGRPIPENDIWISAMAKQHDLTLATRDDHFRHVDGIQIVSW
jgi:tRNA(fMet)-specific endonuclease VapC